MNSLSINYKTLFGNFL